MNVSKNCVCRVGNSYLQKPPWSPSDSLHSYGIFDFTKEEKRDGRGTHPMPLPERFLSGLSLTKTRAESLISGGSEKIIFIFAGFFVLFIGKRTVD